MLHFRGLRLCSQYPVTLTGYCASRCCVTSHDCVAGRTVQDLRGVGEGIDRTGLARVADAARNGPYGTGRVLTLEGIVVLNSLLRPEACEGLAQ